MGFIKLASIETFHSLSIQSPCCCAPKIPFLLLQLHSYWPGWPGFIYRGGKESYSQLPSASSLLHPLKLANPRRAVECQWRAPFGWRIPQPFTAMIGENSSFSIILEKLTLPFSFSNFTAITVTLNSCSVCGVPFCIRPCMNYIEVSSLFWVYLFRMPS